MVIKDIKKFSFGYRFYYWPYYKDNDEQDVLCSPGYKYSDWFVSYKYNTFKNELLDKLHKRQYDICYNKASQYHHSLSIKKIESNPRRESCQYYDIDGKASMSINHLLAIVCYTDLSRLSYEFSLTFRKLNDEESDQHLKQRNSNFAHWSRYLRELVEVWGDQTNPKIAIQFYHGTSNLLFTQFNARFCGPTSTTCT